MIIHINSQINIQYAAKDTDGKYIVAVIHNNYLKMVKVDSLGDSMSNSAK